MDKNEVKISLGELRSRDHGRAMQFAIEGMHLHWYIGNKFLLNLYARYFWYLELTRATQVIAAYADGLFAGILLAELKGEKHKHASFWKSLYVKLFDVLQRLFAGQTVSVYDKANKEMLAHFTRQANPDGEIIFLAADPESKIKGVGSTMLAELEKRNRGKRIYLYTDSACTYQFYERRGFERVGEKDIALTLSDKTIDLTCLLYSKVLGQSTSAS